MIDLFAPRGRTANLPSIADRIDASGDCWEWTGGVDSNGYGRVNGALGNSGLVHRIVYEALCGPIPDGLTLDHLCRVRHCVNPDHLEPVTAQVNTRRGYPGHHRTDACRNGHIRTPENTYLWRLRTGRWGRFCRDCRRDQNRSSSVKAP